MRADGDRSQLGASRGTLALGPQYSNSHSSTLGHKAGWGRSQPSAMWHPWHQAIRRYCGERVQGGEVEDRWSSSWARERGSSEEVTAVRNRLQ